MPKWVSKVLGWTLLCLFLVVTLAGLWAPPLLTYLFEKNYSFPEVAIDAQVHPDGDVAFQERRTFRFHNGPFSYAYYTVADPSSRISDFSMAEIVGGREVLVTPDWAWTGSDGVFEARWSFSAEDQDRTWVFRYRYTCGVDVYTDAAHLNWQFIGTGWDKPTGHARITVHLPEQATGQNPPRPEVCDPEAPDVADPAAGATPLTRDQVRAWGHGPLNGSVSFPDPQTVVYDVHDVPPNAFVEGSVLFPTGAVPFAPQASSPGRDRILADEARWADEANALRARHDTQRAWVLYLLLEPPEDDAVEAAFVWAAWLGRGTAPNAYRAQLLRLVRIGAVEIRAVGTVTEPEDIKLVQRKGPDEVETEADLDFLALLFGDPTRTGHTNEISIMHPTRHGTSGPTWFAAWTKDARSDASKALLRIDKGDARIESTGSALVACIAAGYGIWTAVWGLGGKVGWWLVPVCVLSLIVALRHIPARVDVDLRERVARLAAFRRYLRKFSSLPNAPTMAVIIWERYMEWAAALFVAKRVEKQIRALVPEPSLDTSWLGDDLPAATSFSALNTMLTSADTLAVTSGSSPSSGSSSGGGFGSSSSSSGSSGGGFSSGGGGGHGGTGGGAG
jgi:uncharacterized membrane protein YgcG